MKPIVGSRSVGESSQSWLWGRRASAGVDRLRQHLWVGAEREYVELYLGSDRSRADYSLGVPGLGGGRETFGDGLNNQQALWRRSRGWRCIRLFFERWRGCGAGVLTHVPCAWISFDDVARCSHTLEESVWLRPSLVVGLSREFQLLGRVHIDRDRDLAICEEVLAVCDQDSAQLALDLIREIDRVALTWPITYFSVMLGRTPVEGKFNVLMTVSGFCEAVQCWGLGSIAADLSRLLLIVAGGGSRWVRADVLLGANSHRRLGVELLTRGSDRSVTRRKQIVERALRCGLCSPEDIQRANYWAGRGSDASADWYLKLTAGLGEGISVKMYFGQRVSS